MKILHDKKVVLLEGSRNVLAEDRKRLTAFAQTVAKQYPEMIFRSGNADGSDALFAEGVESVDPKRMEQVLPYSSSHKKRLHEDSRILSLEELNKDEITELAALCIKATPSYKRLVDFYLETMKRNRTTMKIIYLLRDVLKVTGSKRLGFKPADMGVFYLNTDNPTGGGAGHTIRVCGLVGVPVFVQDEWLK